MNNPPKKSWLYGWILVAITGFVGLVLGSVLLVEGSLENPGGAIFVGMAGLVLCLGAWQVFKWYQRVLHSSEDRTQLLELQRLRSSYSSLTAMQARFPGLRAYWQYNQEEWQTYTEREWKFRLQEAAWVGIGTGVLATLILYLTRGEDLMTILAISFGIGLLLFVCRVIIAWFTVRANRTADQAVVFIADNGILLNGKFYMLRSNLIRFGGVQWLDEKPPILEFTVTWDTRRGTSNEQIRVPVPAGKEEEAKALLNF